MSADRSKRKTLIAILLIVFGLCLLPAAIYLVGTVIIGPYEGESIATLYAAILGGLVNLEPAPWLLVLSPFLVVQLLRLSIALRKTRAAVKPVTK